MRPLSVLEVSQLLRCANDHDIRSSDRQEDRARQELRRRGLIVYDGKPKRWRLTQHGSEIASLHENAPSPRLPLVRRATV